MLSNLCEDVLIDVDAHEGHAGAHRQLKMLSCQALYSLEVKGIFFFGGYLSISVSQYGLFHLAAAQGCGTNFFFVFASGELLQMLNRPFRSREFVSYSNGEPHIRSITGPI